MRLNKDNKMAKMYHKLKLVKIKNVFNFIIKNIKVLLLITDLYKWFRKSNIHSPTKILKKLKEKEFIPTYKDQIKIIFNKIISSQVTAQCVRNSLPKFKRK